jgi:hypothetical protein
MRCVSDDDRQGQVSAICSCLWFAMIVEPTLDSAVQRRSKGGTVPIAWESRARTDCAWWWIERLMTVLLLVGAVWPFWSGRFLPFLDLPQHLALSAVIAHYGDPSTGFATYYAVNWHITPYWGFYAAMHLLMSLGLDALAASRLLLTAYAIGLPVSVGYLLAGLDRDWRWAAFTVPLVYNTNLFWGFASFILSLPIYMYALGLTVRVFAAAKPFRRDQWRLAAAATLVYLFHAQSYALLGSCVAALFAIHWLGWRWAVRCVAPFTPSLLLFVFWIGIGLTPKPMHNGHSFGPQSAAGAHGPKTRYEPIATALSLIPERLVGAYNDGSDYRIGAALLIVFLAALVSAAGPLPRHVRAMLIKHRGEALCLLVFASYVATPIELAGQWYVSPRHLIFSALLGPTFLVARPTRFLRFLLVPVCAVGLWASANATAKVRAFQEQVGPFAHVLDHMTPGRRVINLMFDDGSWGPVRYWPFLHWSCYYQAEKGGDVSFSFAGVPSTSIAAAHAIPVSYRAGMQAPHPNEWRPSEFRWDTMGSAYDYFLIRGEPHGDAARLGEHTDLVIRAREWQLWRRRPATE